MEGDGVESTIWGDFYNVFLDSFFSHKLRELKVEDFINLKQGKKSVKKFLNVSPIIVEHSKVYFWC